MDAFSRPEAENAALDAAWSKMCDDLRSAGNLVTRDPVSVDPAMRSAGYRYLLNLLNAGLEQMVFSADPEYPEVGHLQDNTKRYATESPDCLFGHATLDAAGTYRLTGTDGCAALERRDFAAAFKAATGGTLGAISNPGGITLGRMATSK